MVETTVEVEKTVTESELLTICDKCQREVDPDGEPYYSTSDSDSPDLHFCSECLDSFSDEFEDSETQAFREWWEGSYKGNHIYRTTEERFKKVGSGLVITAVGGLFAIIGLGIATIIWTVPYIAWMASSVLMLAIVMGSLGYISSTIRHLRKANEDVFDE
jgi:hypothetical protein